MTYCASAAKKLYSNQENTLSINLIKLPLNMDTSAAVFGITLIILTLKRLSLQLWTIFEILYYLFKSFVKVELDMFSQ